jgi:chromosomal replication initiation ATPase DnaA
MNDVELVRRLQEVAAEEAGLKRGVRELLLHDHEQRKAKFRDSVIYLARTKTDLALEQLGKLFGARHHTTILNAVRREKTRLQRKPPRKDKRTWVEWHEYLYNKAIETAAPVALVEKGSNNA